MSSLSSLQVIQSNDIIIFNLLQYNLSMLPVKIHTRGSHWNVYGLVRGGGEGEKELFAILEKSKLTTYRH